MAFLTNLGVSNGGYPAIRLETATITKNGVYTAPRGVAYSQVNVDVPSSGITDVNVLPDVSSFNEGDVVHLMQDDNRLTPVHLYAWRRFQSPYPSYSRFFSRNPNPSSIDDLVVVTEDGIRKFADVYIGETITIQGTDVYCHIDGETMGPFRRHETDDLVGTFLLYYVGQNGEYVYVTDDTQGDLNSRIYFYYPVSDFEFGWRNLANGIENTASIVDDTLSFEFTEEGGEVSKVIADHDTSGDLLIGDSGHEQGYYKVENGIWVKLGAPTVEFKVYRHMSSSSPRYMTIDGISDHGGLGVMVRKRDGNEWKYTIWMGYNGWRDIDGQYCGELNESWFNSTTEVGYGLQLRDPDDYSGELVSFVKCPYTIIDKNE